jgi:DNA-binding response OmpR family regulator
VTEAVDGQEAINQFDAAGGDFDIALLDVMMPKKDGFEVCKHIRAQSQTIGIIMLTAKTQEMDKISGLMLGADDYVAKPFSPSELMARVDAVARRVAMTKTKTEIPSELRSGVFLLDRKSRTLFKDGEPIDLTQVEFSLIEYFMSNPNIAIERHEILRKIWGDKYVGDEKIVDVNIRRLRMKVEEDPSNPRYILTMWGFGYKWVQ